MGQLQVAGFLMLQFLVATFLSSTDLLWLSMLCLMLDRQQWLIFMVLWLKILWSMWSFGNSSSKIFRKDFSRLVVIFAVGRAVQNNISLSVFSVGVRGL